LGAKICFLSLSAYPIIAKTNIGIAGGAELQQVLIAKELLSLGYKIYFVTYDHGQDTVVNINGIEIIKTYKIENENKTSSLSKLRSVSKALRKADADIYLHSAGSPGVLPFFCFKSRKKFVFRVPSDKVVQNNEKELFNRFTDALDIKRATALIAQTGLQKNRLIKNFGVKTSKITIIKNALPPVLSSIEKPDPPVILWVASIASVKCPELFIELAKELPNARFQMIGGKRIEESRLYDRISESASKVPNLEFKGFIPIHLIDEYYEKASIFVNTSKIEGFPNSFLQAWAHNLPVVSLNVDPDNLIKDNQVGFCCSNSFKRLVSDTANLVNDKKQRQNLGFRAKNLVETAHGIQVMAQQYDSLFRTLLKKAT
jgi:glycosyltransferase involved in cell wall biosynthesis